MAALLSQVVALRTVLTESGYEHTTKHLLMPSMLIKAKFKRHDPLEREARGSSSTVKFHRSINNIINEVTCVGAATSRLNHMHSQKVDIR